MNNSHHKPVALRLLRLSTLARYGTGVVIVGVATLVSMALNRFLSPLDVPFITFYPAVMLSGWIGGAGPGIFTTLLSAVLADYFFMSPTVSLSVANPADRAALLLFELVGIFISLLTESWRHSQAASLRSEAELSVTLGSIGDAVITTDTNGRISFMNEIAESLTAWKEANASGKPLQEILHIIDEETRQDVDNQTLRSMREGGIISLPNQILLVDSEGKETPIEGKASPIKGANGNAFGAVLILRDIGERRRVQRLQDELLVSERKAHESDHNARIAAEATQQRLQLALAAGRMGTWQYSVRTGSVTWSPGLEQIHGYNPGTFPGTFDAFREEIHPDDRDLVLSAVREAIERRQEHHIEYRIIRKDGSVRWVEGRGQLVVDAAGNSEGMVGICTDITARKRAAEAERAAKRSAEEANRAKDDFLATLSHELRTPLSSILGWSTILRSGQLTPEESDRALEVIERNARVEAQLVESLLDLSQIIAGKLKLVMARVDLSSLVLAAVDSLRPAADNKGVLLEASVPPVPLTIIGDSGRLQEVFSNIISNAVKFTSRGGHVYVRLTRTRSAAQVQVVDNGEGMSAAFLPYIFDRFRQAESNKERSHGGLGLGLAIVRELVNAHAGMVAAESPGKGQGSTFTVALPIPAVIPAYLETKPAHVPATTISGLRVLVVDDDADARELVALTLGSHGAIVQTASSAGEALDHITREKPDVLLADIGMPQEDGYVLIQRLRAREREQSEKRLPAIALTAFAGTADREQALAAGYHMHLTKPVGPNELAQAVAKFPKQREHQA